MNRSRTRRLAAASLALAAVATAGALQLAPTPSPHPAISRTPAAVSRERPATTNVPTRAALSAPLAAARRGARRFVTLYLALVNGRGRRDPLRAAAPTLRRELRRHPPRVTPAQQRIRPAVRELTVEATGDLALAVATLQDPGGPPYRLVFYLERRHARWRATRLADR